MNTTMKNYRILLTALSTLAIVGCVENVNPDVPLVEREKEPLVFEGSGNLCYVGDDESDVEIETSTYTWSAHDDVIEISANIDLNEYKTRGAYEIGHFTLPAATIAEFLGGVSVMDLDSIFSFSRASIISIGVTLPVTVIALNQ